MAARSAWLGDVESGSGITAPVAGDVTASPAACRRSIQASMFALS